MMETHGSEIFGRAMRPFGGALMRQQIHPDTAPGFDEIRHYLRQILSSKYTRHVHFDWVDNLSFNAVATEFAKHELIGVFAGAVIQVYNYFYCFLTDPSVFPAIGQSSLEVIDSGMLRSLASRQYIPCCPLPRDHVRQRIAMRLAWCAVLFLFMHELAHIVLCHIRLICEIGERAEYLELPLTECSPELARVRLLLEIDADQSAARVHLRRWRMIWSADDRQSFGEMSAELSWSIALAMLFRIMDGQLNPPRPRGRTHPPPMMRFVHAINIALQPDEPAFVGGEDTVLEGMAEVFRWWKSNGLPMRGGDHSVTLSAIDELNTLRVELAERFSDKLNQFQHERRLIMSTE
jgi:hypothetical protein